MTEVTVRAMEADDWPAVERIYAQGIATGNATFEAEPPSWEDFNQSKRADLRFVADEDADIVGWAAASPVSARPAYAGVVEHSIYVSAITRGRGVGSQLLGRLIHDAKNAGVWTIQSSIFPENAPSLALHKQHGFREIGRRERIAFMTYGPWGGTWSDTVLIEQRLPQPR